MGLTSLIWGHSEASSPQDTSYLKPVTSCWYKHLVAKASAHASHRLAPPLLSLLIGGMRSPTSSKASYGPCRLGSAEPSRPQSEDSSSCAFWWKVPCKSSIKVSGPIAARFLLQLAGLSVYGYQKHRLSSMSLELS